jgi:hypothetical protein
MLERCCFFSFARHFCFVFFSSCLSYPHDEQQTILKLFISTQSLFAKEKKFLHCVSLKDCSDPTLANFDIKEFFLSSEE